MANMRLFLLVAAAVPAICFAQGQGSWGSGMASDLLPYFFGPLFVSVVLLGRLLLTRRWQVAVVTLLVFALLLTVLASLGGGGGAIIALVAGPAILCLIALCSAVISKIPPKPESSLGDSQEAALGVEAHHRVSWRSPVPPDHLLYKVSYWICFVIVGWGAFWGLAAVLSHVFGMKTPDPGAAGSFFYYFSSLFPTWWRWYEAMPWLLYLNSVLTFCLVRRAWLLLARREGIPQSYRGALPLLGCIGICSLLFAVAAFLPNAVLHDRQDVPRGLLYLPAVFLIPWTFFLTELLDIRAAWRGKQTHQ